MKTALSKLIKEFNTIHEVKSYSFGEAKKVFFKKYRHRIAFRSDDNFPTAADKELLRKNFGRNVYSGEQLLKRLVKAYNEEAGKERLKSRREWYTSLYVYAETEDDLKDFLELAKKTADLFYSKPFTVKEVLIYAGPEDLHNSKVICNQLPHGGKYSLKVYIKASKIPESNRDRIADFLQNSSKEDVRCERYLPRYIRNGSRYGWRTPKTINMKDRKVLFAFSLIAGDCIYKVEEYITKEEIREQESSK